MLLPLHELLNLLTDYLGYDNTHLRSSCRMHVQFSGILFHKILYEQIPHIRSLATLLLQPFCHLPFLFHNGVTKI